MVEQSKNHNNVNSFTNKSLSNVTPSVFFTSKRSNCKSQNVIQMSFYCERFDIFKISKLTPHVRQNSSLKAFVAFDELTAPAPAEKNELCGHTYIWVTM